MKVIDHYYLDQTEKITFPTSRKVRFISLLEEIVNALVESGHTPREVDFVSTSRARCSWVAFCDIARGLGSPYEHGGPALNDTLMVVGKGDWWLERAEYDGSEWWVCRRLPDRERSRRPLMKRDLINEDET